MTGFSAPSRRQVLAGMACLAATPPARASGPKAPFRRGVSIHNLMNWGAVEDKEKGVYRWPPFGSVHHQIQPQLYAAIPAAGFDFVRLTLDPGVFMQLSGPRRDELDQQLVANIRTLQALKLGVVVDFHPNSQVAAYAPEKITERADTPLFRDYTEMLERTARLLNGFRGTRIALELMNEPQWGWDGPTAARWADMQKGWHDRVRRIAPALTLVLTGARGGNADGLRLIDAKPFAGSDVLWSFHYYEPYELTHQGVAFSDPKSRSWKYFSDIPYPGAPEHFDDAFPIIAANIAADKTLTAEMRKTLTDEARAGLTRYLAANPGRRTVARHFTEVADWAKANGVAGSRIFLGEFGVTRTYGPYKASPPQPLGNWLSDVRLEAEARGFGWAFWALSGYGGMSLIETDESVRFDAPTIAALGLNGAGRS